MLSLRQMNEVAAEVLARDDGPYPKEPDMEIFTPGPNGGSFSRQRIGRDSQVSQAELLSAIYGQDDPSLLPVAAEPKGGNHITGFDRRFTKGIVTGAAYLVLRSTPGIFVPGQAKLDANDIHHANPAAMRYFDYVGSRVVPIIYKRGENRVRIHAVLWAVTRAANSQIAQPLQGQPLLFGAEAIREAEANRYGHNPTTVYSKMTEALLPQEK